MLFACQTALPQSGAYGRDTMSGQVSNEHAEGAASSSGEKADNIRSVARAIDLLQSLNRRALSSLHDLHSDTGLPKPTIVRLLRTLEGKGLVAQSSSYGSYHLLGRVKSLSSGFHHEPLVIEVAEEPMIAYTVREGWPLALATYDFNAMVVRVSTIPHTSLSLHHSTLNMRLAMMSRAIGRAYFAHCGENERNVIREVLKDSTDPENALVHDPVALAEMVARVREQGYATRDPAFDVRSTTLAVPVHQNGRVIASLGITWIGAAMTREEGVRRFAPQLQDLAKQIAEELSSRPAETPRLRIPLGEAIP